MKPREVFNTLNGKRVMFLSAKTETWKIGFFQSISDEGVVTLLLDSKQPEEMLTEDVSLRSVGRIV